MPLIRISSAILLSSLLSLSLLLYGEYAKYTSESAKSSSPSSAAVKEEQEGRRNEMRGYMSKDEASI